jgi:hypothetical protein
MEGAALNRWRMQCTNLESSLLVLLISLGYFVPCAILLFLDGSRLPDALQLPPLGGPTLQGVAFLVGACRTRFKGTLQADYDSESLRRTQRTRHGATGGLGCNRLLICKLIYAPKVLC